MRNKGIISLLVLGALAIAPAAKAVVLTDANSSALINTTAQSGMQNWYIDGVDRLFQQWFWYRVGSTGPEASIDALSLNNTVLSGTNGVQLVYCNVAGCGSGFSIDITYTLIGGSAGSGQSDIAETIRIRNLNQTALDFHFFQYSDFDLGGTGASNETVTFANANLVTQSSPVGLLSETVISPAPGHREGACFETTRTKLNDAVATTLNDLNTGINCDATWAFQWDTRIAAGGSFLISKDKRMDAAVPEPGGILLLGSGLLVAAQTLRRKLAGKA